MNAIKTLLLLSLAINLVLGWLWWRDNIQVGAVSEHEASGKEGP